MPDSDQEKNHYSLLRESASRSIERYFEDLDGQGAVDFGLVGSGRAAARRASDVDAIGKSRSDGCVRPYDLQVAVVVDFGRGGNSIRV